MVLAEELDAAGEKTIDEIVIVAHKNERSIRDVAANVTTVSKQELENSIAADLDDAFRYTPSVSAETSGNRFGTEGINIRGVGGNRVAILIDGVPLSDQFDIGSYSNATRDFVNAGLVQRMEVLHGPASALYGSSAIGGVLAIRTPDPIDLIESNDSAVDVVTAWRGADESIASTGIVALGDEHLGILIGGSWRKGNESDSAAVDKSIDTQDYTRKSGLFKYVLNTNGEALLRLSYAHQSARVDSDQQSVLGTGRFRSNTALSGDDKYQMDLINLEYEFGGHREQWVDNGVFRLYYQLANVQQGTLDERGLARTPVSIQRDFEFDQKIRGFEFNVQKYINTKNTSQVLAFGLEYRGRKTEEIRDGLSTNLNDGSQTNVLLGEEFPLRDFPISDSSEWGVYIEDSIYINDWTIIAGVRGDYYDLSPRKDSLYAEDYPFANPVSVDVSDWSPKVGLVYHLGDNTDVYLQFTQGFRAPPYSDANIGLEIPFFNYRAIPNPDLRSETSKGFDTGLRWRGDLSSFHVGVFQTNYSDFIESRRQIGTDPVSGRVLFQSVNIEKAIIKGLEAGGALNFDGALQNLSVDAAVYVARGENRDSSEPLNTVGPAQGVIGISWQSLSNNSQVRLQTTMTSGWEKVDETSGELFKPAGQVVLDLFYKYRIGKDLSLRMSANNLTNKTYWRWSDVRGLSPSDPVIPYLSMPGRNVSLSLTMNWR